VNVPNRVSPHDPVKPLYGEPCNGCGLCCVMEQCDLSKAFFGEQHLCPALEPRRAGGYDCGLITRPGFYGVNPGLGKVASEAFAIVLGAGQGCDGVASDEDRARAPLFDADIQPRAEAAYAGASAAARELIDIIAPTRRRT